MQGGAKRHSTVHQVRSVLDASLQTLKIQLMDDEVITVVVTEPDEDADIAVHIPERLSAYVPTKYDTYIIEIKNEPYEFQIDPDDVIYFPYMYHGGGLAPTIGQP